MSQGRAVVWRRLPVVIALLVTWAWMGMMYYRMDRTHRMLSHLLDVRVGAAAEDVKAHSPWKFTEIRDSAALSREPYSGYEHSSRPFPDYVLVAFVDGELLQVHCGKAGTVECVYWGRKKR